MLTELALQVKTYVNDVFIQGFNGWVVLGFVAQSLFFMRFAVQWIASERVGRSVFPFAFWLFSLGGGMLLLVYALHRRDPVFIAGQGLGLIVYIRNIQFVLNERRARQAVAHTPDAPALGADRSR